MATVSKNYKPENPEEVLRSMGVVLKYRQYVYLVEQAQKNEISISEYIRDLVDKDHAEKMGIVEEN